MTKTLDDVAIVPFKPIHFADPSENIAVDNCLALCGVSGQVVALNIYNTTCQDCLDKYSEINKMANQ